MIENLGATQDQYDVIDLSDNEIRKLDNFPILRRCHTLFISSNQISRVDASIGEALPSLTTIVLTNNQLTELADLHNLAYVKRLTCLSLLGNPVTKRANYRLFVIHILPTVRLLDFRKVKQKERDAALKMFGVRKPLVPASSLPSDDKDKETSTKPQSQISQTSELTPDQVARIKKAIAEANSLEEVNSLERALKLGIIPESLKETDDTTTGNDTVTSTDIATSNDNDNTNLAPSNGTTDMETN
eukprot:c6448_g1_i2.p1 GENE.c6448_g1_i2~~c6448_g1_i2.p1  ORF type:complete len:244 (+),score=67.67 c6448_g1_i2:322-1053(+)